MKISHTGNIQASDGTKARVFAEPILRAIFSRGVVLLDFSEMEDASQPELHALLFEAVRVAWAVGNVIYVVGARPHVRAMMEFVEHYALEG